MTQPKLDDYRWLVSAEAAEWLRAAAAEQSTLAVAGRLRRSLSANQTHLAIQQVELRRHACEKFTCAESLFFTPTGLEQATDEHVAAYKASRFPADLPVVDLCCGIGGDLLALAARGTVLGVDLDERTALLAAANLRASALCLPPRSAGVIVADVSRLAIDGFAACHIDPDRRPTGRRTTRPVLHEPGVEAIDALRSKSPNLAIKLAPAAVLPVPWQAEAELEWISRGGECRQLVAWFGSLIDHTCRAGLALPNLDLTSQCHGKTCPTGATSQAGLIRATLVGPGGQAIRTIVASALHEPDEAESLGRYLYEPDPAVIAAGLVGSLAAEHGLQCVSPGIAYLSGDREVYDAALAGFELTELLPLDLKRLRQALRQRNVGRLEIKKRGVPHDPEQVRRQMQLRGSESATLILTRFGERPIAAIARRLPARSITEPLPSPPGGSAP